jgi:hypothetical protein
LDREKALLGDDAAEFATASDSRLATVEDDDDDLLGGDDSVHYGGDKAQEVLDFESDFPDISAEQVIVTLHLQTKTP